MAMRLSGLMSGMDTESIIQQLVEAKSTKVKSAKKAQTKLEWKQEAWKDLNTKLKNLQSKFLSNMRFSTAYTKKTTKVSNSNAVSVITGENAVNGVQSLEIKQLAKSGYMTGGVVEAVDTSEDVNAMTELSKLGFSGDGVINIKAGKTSVDIAVNGNTTISDVLSQLKDAGLNASFDTKWKRFSISSKESGVDNNFSITAVNGDGFEALKAMKLVSLEKNKDGSESADYAEYLKYAGYTSNDLQKVIDEDVKSKTAAYLEKYSSLSESLASETDPDAVKKLQDQLDEVKLYINVAEDGTVAATEALKYDITRYHESKKEISEKIVADVKKAEDEGKGRSALSSASKVDGRNAKIELNGAEYENGTNSFEINGLTFTALGETKDGEEITVTTEQDVDGIYDMVKSFLKEYNEIINEMDKLYNADSARGYEPLSDDERESMSESEIEKYEKKIKDSLLRRDDNLYTVSDALKSIMSGGIEVNGKTMHLFDFGINTLSYFNTGDNEKNAYHIDGDPDDTSTSGNADKLKSMIANDPDTVISFFTKLSQNMYSKMSDLSKSVDGYRSFGNFYDDKKMKSDYDDYKTKITDLESKLNDYEDKWYKKFSAMETAMAKMQQNASAVTSLLGGS